MEKYFAYGSNMNIEQMRERCPSARPVAKATLIGYRFDFSRKSDRWNGGVAGILPASTGAVEGVVYEVSAEDLSVLDGYEGVGNGRYRREAMTVQLQDGTRVAAWTYFANQEPGGPFPPSKEYLDTIISGAREHNLSGEYIDQLIDLAEGVRREGRILNIKYSG